MNFFVAEFGKNTVGRWELYETTAKIAYFAEGADEEKSSDFRRR